MRHRSICYSMLRLCCTGQPKRCTAVSQNWIYGNIRIPYPHESSPQTHSYFFYRNTIFFNDFSLQNDVIIFDNIYIYIEAAFCSKLTAVCTSFFFVLIENVSCLLSSPARQPIVIFTTVPASRTALTVKFRKTIKMCVCAPAFCIYSQILPSIYRIQRKPKTEETTLFFRLDFPFLPTLATSFHIQTED